ncbi:MAG: polysulfide reductase NrfD [Gammaproteobacteria bacterium]|nr:polysulfide reductase NrfD [Gammaproteobacteria bacterium]MDH3559541.1 polysulfide reductase NrfD [Gammaproteobacteria bacterium]
MHELTWGLPVVAYLFMAGLGAGALTTSASVLLRGGPSGKYFDVARYGAFIAPIPVALGSALLVLELGSFQAGHWFRFLNLYKVINLSPMSLGTWLLTAFLMVSVVYAYTFLSRNPLPGDTRDMLRRLSAWVGIPLGIGVAVYTGVLLGALPSRPFWNSPVLAMLFLLSSISTGIAAIILVRALLKRKVQSDTQTHNYNETGFLLSATDTLLIGLELLALFLFVMYAHLTIGNAKAAIAVIMVGGELSTLFWLWVVVIGLLVPALIELALIVPRIVYQKAFYSHRAVDILVPVSVLIGGFMLRYVVVIAGQITYPIGL